MQELRRKADIKFDLLADLYVDNHRLTNRAEAAQGEVAQLRRDADSAADMEEERAEELARLKDSLAQMQQARVSAET